MNLSKSAPHVRESDTYRTDATDLISFVRKPLRTVTFADPQAWMDTLERLAPASCARKIASVKSLFGFGHPPRLPAL
jgi:integrase/recombinase XerD